MADIDSLVRQIRTAVYGREVRTAIADGILQAYNKNTLNVRVDGMVSAANTGINRYAVCSTEGLSPNKKAYTTSGSFYLEKGARVTVVFSYNNLAPNPTLNVNNTGAKSIFHRGASIRNGVNLGLLSGACDFIYDGIQWHLVGNYITSTDENPDSTSLDDYLTKDEASSTYLTQVQGNQMYIKRSEVNTDGELNLSEYMTKTDLANMYLNKTDAESIYLSKDQVGKYVLTCVVSGNDALKVPLNVRLPNGTIGLLRPSYETTGKIYLVGTYESKNSRFDEYITVPEGDGYVWEKLGGDLDSYTLLELDDIPGTTQSITFAENGDISEIRHSTNSLTRRTDTFVFTDTEIIETRTLATGESLTITTNTNTLKTTTVYSMALGG